MKNLELLRCLNCGGNLHWGDDNVVVCPYCKSEYIKEQGFTTYSEKEKDVFQVDTINLENPKVIINAYGKTFEFYVSSFEMESPNDIDEYTFCDGTTRTFIRNRLPNIDMHLVGIREIKEKR